MSRTRSLALAVAALSCTALFGASLVNAAPPARSPTAASTVPPSDDPASPGGLNEAVEQSSAAPYRLEMFMEMSFMGMNIDGDTPLMTGEYAGEQSHLVMDFGAIFAGIIADSEMPPELRGADLSMEFVTDGTDMYIRAPFFALMADEANDPSLAVFTELGDGWGYVDGTAVPGVNAGSMTGMLGVGGADPSAFFELLSDVEGAEQIGTEDIRGVNTTGVRADVNLADLMAAQGNTAALPEGSTPFGDATFPIEVWIDKDGYVRRITFDINGDAIAEAAEASGEDIPSSMFADMEMSMTMEMFDYGAEDIAIEIPTEFTDVTEAFAELVQASS